MPPFFQDALDLARFRVKALEHYAYDWWLPVLWLSFLAVVPPLLALAGSDAPIAMLLTLSLALTWVTVLMLTFFFGWWLKRDPASKVRGSLFPLVVLASSGQLLGPLLALLPGGLRTLAHIALLVYQFWVLATALSRATGMSSRYVLKGFLHYFAAWLIVGVVLSVIAGMLGLLPAPPGQADPAKAGRPLTQVQEQP
ncbi:hypothetical protein FNU76_17355 [Chitinimonas arctica]|uniref:DUF1282 domain-containing protein n=1 Tax=Chitinimonas arctica TaxID=2594795 RepID=A0A516SIV1_9NEIS|nr:hypothetical protein [Chitinimonas arctica]QDQ27968.1 hypothetical protein FNU76_17355 [Chitinimonas arctica]